MSFEVGDLDISRASALLAAAARTDDLGILHQVEEALADGRGALLVFSIVHCVSEAMGPERFYDEEVARHFSRLAGHHRNLYEEQMTTLAAQQYNDSPNEGDAP